MLGCVQNKSSGGFTAVDLLGGRKRQIAVTFHPEPFVLENKGLDGEPPRPPPPHHPLHKFIIVDQQLLDFG